MSLPEEVINPYLGADAQAEAGQNPTVEDSAIGC
jgi:hypothetical protein